MGVMVFVERLKVAASPCGKPKGGRMLGVHHTIPRARRLPLGGAAVAVAIALAVLTVAAPPARATPFPPLPVAEDATFFSNLSAPSLTPGGSGTITFHVADPGSFVPMTGVTVTLEVYAFNAFPGNATSSVGTASAPVLVTPTTSGSTANLSLGNLSPGNDESVSVGVATAASTPAGTFAVRTALAFLANGTNYRLESRGWFTAGAWAAATELPNGSATLNLSALGVSGVTAETAIYVTSSSWEWALALILGASIVLVGAGAFVYFRRTAKSSSGVR